MARNQGKGIIHMLTVILGGGLLLVVVLTAAVTFLPGSKIGHVYGLKPEELENLPPQRLTMKQWQALSEGAPADAGTAADAGTLAATPAAPRPSAPAEAQALPEQHGR